MKYDVAQDYPVNISWLVSMKCIRHMIVTLFWRLRLKERERNTVLRRTCKFKLVVKSFHENPYVDMSILCPKESGLFQRLT